MLDFQGARWLMSGEVPGQAGNNHPTSAPTGVYKTVERLHQHRDHRRENVGAAVRGARRASISSQAPEYVNGKERLRTFGSAAEGSRRRHQRRTPAIEWVEILNEAGVPTGPIYKIDEVFADPQVKHLKAAQTVKGKHGAEDHAGAAVHAVAHAKQACRSRRPDIGEHTGRRAQGIRFQQEADRRSAQGESHLKILQQDLMR